MSHNVIECIFQGEEQAGLYMIFPCVLRLRDEVYVFQSDWPHVHINFPLAHHRLHLEVSIVVVKRQAMFRTELHQGFGTFSRTLFIGDRDRIDDILLRTWLTMPAWAVAGTDSVLITRKADQLVEPCDLRAVSAVECPIPLTCPECQPWLRECHNVAFLGIGKRTSLECGFTLLFSTIKASDGTLLVLKHILNPQSLFNRAIEFIGAARIDKKLYCFSYPSLRLCCSDKCFRSLLDTVNRIFISWKPRFQPHLSAGRGIVRKRCR